ncbi:MAG: hypothetical protein WBD27_10535 [Pyrinomonadaceae bacterium]
MESLQPDNQCPKCHFHRMTAWNDLLDDEKMIAKLAPTSANFSARELELMTFCVRCWYVRHSRKETLA